MLTSLKRLGGADLSSTATAFKRTAAVVLAMLVGAAILAVGSPASAEDEFTTSAGTPDNTTFREYYENLAFASVMWNDYADDDHSRDLDDFHICDIGADNLAPLFQAGYDGQVYSERIDGGKGNCEVQGVGNVPAGSPVHFRVCPHGLGTGECLPWRTVYE